MDGTTYSLASGVVIALMCFLGLFQLLGALLPLPAIVPILLYIGLLIGAQAFQETPKRHAVAVVFALIPNIASWASGLIDNALAAAGTSAAKVGEEALTNAGLVYEGLKLLGGGAILAGLVLGAITAFIIDKEFISAAVYCFIGAALGFIGLIHAEQVGWNVGGQIALGYEVCGDACCWESGWSSGGAGADPHPGADDRHHRGGLAASSGRTRGRRADPPTRPATA